MIERVTDNFRRVKRLAPDWDLIPSSEIYYLVVTENGEDVGAICFHPCDQDGLLMHVALGEKCRGARAALAYHNAFDWIFTNTTCQTIHGRIPGPTKPAKIMARHVGGEFTGIDVDGLRCYRIDRNSFNHRKAA